MPFEQTPLAYALLVAAYLLGSLPFGLILTRLAGMGDIRKIGSGNIGATNVLRTGNKLLALLTLLLDGGKGALAVFLGHFAALYYGMGATSDMPLLMGLCAVVGHIYPIWLFFRGGKGVATALGFVLAISWPVGAGMILTWLLIAFAYRISSLAAIIAAISCPIYTFYMERYDLIKPMLFLSALIIWKHRENIARIFKGVEPKIGKTKA
jgi:glycerol-3-phosphate acyltransferase PlsY